MNNYLFGADTVKIGGKMIQTKNTKISTNAPLRVDDPRIDTILSTLYKLSKQDELLLKNAILHDLHINSGVKSGRNILDKLYKSIQYINALCNYDIFHEFKNNPKFAMMLCFGNVNNIPLFLHLFDYVAYKEILDYNPGAIQLFPTEIILTRRFYEMILPDVLKNMNSAYTNLSVYLPAQIFDDIDFFLMCHTHFTSFVRHYSSCTVYRYLTDCISDTLYLQMQRYSILIGKFFIRNLFNGSIVLVKNGKEVTIFLDTAKNGIFKENAFAKHFPGAHTLEQVVHRNYRNAIDILVAMKKEEFYFQRNILRMRRARDVRFKFEKIELKNFITI